MNILFFGNEVEKIGDQRVDAIKVEIEDGNAEITQQ